MAYDEQTADRFRQALTGLVGLSEKKMMGGLCFLLNGNMVGGVSSAKAGPSRFMFRVGKDNEAEASALPGGEPMVHGGRRMSGFFHVDEETCDDALLRDWVSLAVSHTLSLPEK